ncbi:esterase, putative [Perkinsus marinus ATCC 50983]|uniref:Esterase, putative n=1 Tax=Perkinsus marinus (strain ATCC 50983 / TXsc) TaxID=423536 RepID=C5LFY1_PERM5|nr:esterase, putative [Perkinsus marinus ATCC 50983]EER04362.1 esterase, putative [Perkinsus marinus ATCC 50983]|eukprot:XP_002772546.1 esterase, putative [Perkinsus marinus ATCC 50983]
MSATAASTIPRSYYPSQFARNVLKTTLKRMANNFAQNERVFWHDRAVIDSISKDIGQRGTWKERCNLSFAQVSPYCTAHVLEARKPAKNSLSKWLLYLHGGYFCLFSPEYYYEVASKLAEESGCQGVIIPHYRRPPEHNAPAALEDCVSTYRWMRSEGLAQQVAVAGDSAGGNLGAALMLLTQDQPPEACCLLSPYLDLTNGSDSYQINKDTDPIVSDELNHKVAWIYLQGALDYDSLKKDCRVSQPSACQSRVAKFHVAAQNPLASPVYASNLPEVFKNTPLQIQASLSEALLSDSVRFYSKVTGMAMPSTEELVRHNEYIEFDSPQGHVLELFPKEGHAFPVTAPKRADSQKALQSTSAFFRNALNTNKLD